MGRVQRFLWVASVVVTSPLVGSWACSVNDVPGVTPADASTDKSIPVDAFGSTDSSSSTDSPTPDTSVEAAFDAGTGFATITSFCWDVCALMHDGRVACWGANNANALLGVTPDGGVAYVPQYVPGISNAAQLWMSNYIACAVLGNGSLRCWGQLVNTIWDPSHTVLTSDGGVLSNAKKVTVGQGMINVVLTTQHAFGFGDNQTGGLSNGGTVSSNIPTEMVSGFGVPFTNVIDVATTQTETGCLVLSDGTVHCAGAQVRGDGVSNQNGLAFADEALFPDGGPLTGVGQLTCGYTHCCAVQTDGATVNCFGANYFGERGTNASAEFSPWVDFPVTGLKGKVVSIAAGYYTSCAIIDDGTVQCWGLDGSGELGDGLQNNTPHYSAVSVVGLPAGKAVSVTTARSFSCAVMDDGTAWCWGDGTNGLLGDGQGKPSLKPVQVKMPQ